MAAAVVAEAEAEAEAGGEGKAAVGTHSALDVAARGGGSHQRQLLLSRRPRLLLLRLRPLVNTLGARGRRRALRGVAAGLRPLVNTLAALLL